MLKADTQVQIRSKLCPGMYKWVSHKRSRTPRHSFAKNKTPTCNVRITHGLHVIFVITFPKCQNAGIFPNAVLFDDHRDAWSRAQEQRHFLCGAAYQLFNIGWSRRRGKSSLWYCIWLAMGSMQQWKRLGWHQTTLFAFPLYRALQALSRRLRNSPTRQSHSGNKKSTTFLNQYFSSQIFSRICRRWSLTKAHYSIVSTSMSNRPQFTFRMPSTNSTRYLPLFRIFSQTIGMVYVFCAQTCHSPKPFIIFSNRARSTRRRPGTARSFCFSFY